MKITNRLKKSEKPTTNIDAIVGDAKVDSPKRKPIKINKKLALTSIVLLLVAGLFTYYYITQKTDLVGSVEKDGQVVPTSEDIQKEIEQTSNPEKKAELYTDLSTSKQLEGKPEEAVQAAETAVATSGSVESYAQLAYLEEQRGNNAKAAEYYEKAASLSTPTEDPDAYTDYNYYKGRAEYLRSL